MNNFCLFKEFRNKNRPIKTLQLSCPECNTPITLPPHKSKRINILIALKLLQTSKLYEEAILISGDQDFIPIIDYLRNEEGKIITIASFR